MFTNIETEGLGTFSICVRYFPGVGQLERFIPPSNLREDNLPVVAREMLLTERLSLPDYAHSVWEAELGLDGFGEIGFKKIGFEIYRAASASLKGDDQIGFFGYLPGTTGDDPTPDRDHVRFASLRISEDAGIAHLAIHKDDLKSLDLRSLKYVWLDWDS